MDTNWGWEIFEKCVKFNMGNYVKKGKIQRVVLGKKRKIDFKFRNQHKSGL